MNLNSTLKGLFFVSLLFFIGFSSQAQQCPVGYTVPVTITETSGFPQTNYQARITFDTQTAIAATEMRPDAGDIRFSSDMANTIPLDFYVEPATINTTNTQIWVKIPSLTGGGNVTVYMHYGDLNLLSASDLSATFPTSFVSSGNSTLSADTINAEWFEIQAGDTVTAIGGSVVLLNAKRVLIDGVLSIDSAGYAATAGTAAGNGPGGGGTGSAAGFGGAGYGGAGGLGGYDGTDTPGTGGPVYGNNNLPDIQMGSSGASVSTTLIGGDGGGAIEINAELIDVNGSLSARGGDGDGPGGQNAGGGSGGGILLIADAVNITGLVSAHGGNGGNGNSTANDGGGAGGGGRVKIFHDTYYNLTGTIDVIGGIGGVYGNASNGEDGDTGTVFDAVATYPASSTFAFGSPTFFGSPMLLNSSPSVTCDGDSVSFTADISGLSSYTYSVNGTQVQTGANASYGGNLQDGDTITCIGQDVSCYYEAQAVLNMLPLPTPVISGVGNTTCNATSFDLSTTQSYVAYVWSTGQTGANITVTTSGPTCVTVIDSNGCSADTCLNIEIGYPNPVINGPTSVCEGDSATLTVPGVYQWYFWSDGTIFNTTDVPAGTYSVTVTDTNGCVDSTSFTVASNAAPLPTVTLSGSVLTSSAATGYQWYLNGSPISGATSQSYTMTADGYYYVEVTYANGCTRASIEQPVFLSVDELFATGIELYPNPTSDNLNVVIDGMNDNQAVAQIFDAQGKMVLNTNVRAQGASTSVVLDLTDLESGLYIIRLIGDSGQAQLQFVKN